MSSLSYVIVSRGVPWVLEYGRRGDQRRNRRRILSPGKGMREVVVAARMTSIVDTINTRSSTGLV